MNLKSMFPRKNCGESIEVEYTGEPCLDRLVPGSLDDFVQYQTLGTGTFGRVRLVQYVGTHQDYKDSYYAMKQLKKRIIMRQKQIAHVMSEISLLASISHPFIVNMVNNFHDKERIYLILEFVQGGELFSLFRFQERFPNEEAKFYCAQISAAFFYLHARKIAYRDLKPENVLITLDGYLKLTDFGFAKVIPDRTWTLCGTPEYLAPEIVTGKGHSLGVDWWAMGVFAYELLAGMPPFYAENPVQIYQQILNANLELFNYFDPSAIDLLTRLLQRDVSKRLGCMKNGYLDVKNASWYSNIDFVELENCQIPSFYNPPTAFIGDTSNFDEFSESIDENMCNVQVFVEGKPIDELECVQLAFSDLENIGFAPCQHEEKKPLQRAGTCFNKSPPDVINTTQPITHC